MKVGPGCVWYNGRGCLIDSSAVSQFAMSDTVFKDAAYQSLFDRVPVALYRTTPDGRILHANPALVRLLGYPDRETLLQVNVKDIHLDGGARADQHRLLATGQTVRNYEMRLRHYDGSVIWVHDSARAYRDEHGRVIYYEGSLENITDRKLAETAETEQRRLLKSLRDVALALTSQTELEAVLGEVIHQTRRLVRYSAANIALLEDDMLRIVQVDGYPPQISRRLTTPQRRWDTLPLDKRAIDTRRSVVVQDTKTDDNWLQLGQTKWRSYLAVPIVLRDEVLGLLRLNGQARGMFSADTATLLEPLATAAAIAIENARLLETARQQAAQLESLRKMSQDLVAVREVDQLLPLICERVMRLIDGTSAGIYLYQADTDTLELVVIVGDSPVPQGTVLVEGEGLSGTVWLTRQPKIVYDYANWPGRSPKIHGVESTLIAVPLQWSDQFLGVLTIGLGPDDERVVSAEEMGLVTQFAAQAALAVQNAQLYDEMQSYSTYLERAVSARTADLQRAKERAEAILHSAADPMIITDRRAVIQSVNRAFEQMTGFSAAEVSDNHARDLVDPSYRITHSNLLEQAVRLIKAGRPWRGEVVVRTRDGGAIETEVNMALLCQDNVEYGFVVVMRDISRLKAVERMKDAFVSNVSHELRSPIASLKLYHSLMGMAPERAGTYMPRIGREIERLATIIEDLLTLSRLDEDRVPTEYEVLDLNDLVAPYITDREPLAAERDLALEFQPVASVPPVMGDAGMLGQVLVVLLTNALNYTPAGGRIVVKTVAREQRWAGISVDDTGPGINPADQEIVFSRFYRGQSGRNSGAPGTGLGLAIAKEIVERHHGFIDVRSEGVPGKGACFTVWLPAQRQ